MKLIEKADPSCTSDLICQSNLQGHIAITYSLGIFAFVALVPYIRNTMGLLTPSKIMSILAMDITKDNILESIKRETADEANPNDAILPIIDIVRSALMKYDYETTRDGLRTIRVSTNHMLETETFEEEEEEKISDHLFAHLTRIGRLALSRDDEYSTVEIITNLGKIGETSTKIKLEFVTYETINVLCEIGIKAAERKLEWPTIMVIKTFQKIVQPWIENELDIRTMKVGLWEASYLEEIGMVAVDNRLDRVTRVVASSLGRIGISAAENKNRRMISKIIEYLRNMGTLAKDRGSLKLKKAIGDSIYSVYIPIPSEFELEKEVAFKALVEVDDYENA